MPKDRTVTARYYPEVILREKQNKKKKKKKKKKKINK